jgi:hypothetical protein
MSSNKSILITGGTVVNASGEVLADVMIDQGVVQALNFPRNMPLKAKADHNASTQLRA